MMRKWCIGAMVMAMLAAPVFGACPNKCSGHGRCGKNDVCDCMQNWTGGDCAGRVCPFVRAWHDTAEADNEAHYYAECGNRGICDREKGVCECDEPFSGSGCRRMGCPSDCSGHGTCEFIEELARDNYNKRVGGAHGRVYTLWDQEKIMGCSCDPGFEGHNCAKRVCPKGDDPLTTDQYEMTQAITLNEASIEGFLIYHDPYGNAWKTERIAFGLFGDQAVDNPLTSTYGSCARIQTALRRLPNNVLNTVVVEAAADYYPFTRDSHTSKSGTVGAQVTGGGTTKTICIVSFQAEPGTTGYQNLLECDISPHAVVGQHPKTVGTLVPATKCLVTETTHTIVPGPDVRPLSELDECAKRGLCDGTTGICKCYAGHMGLACQKQEALV